MAPEHPSRPNQSDEGFDEGQQTRPDSLEEPDFARGQGDDDIDEPADDFAKGQRAGGEGGGGGGEGTFASGMEQRPGPGGGARRAGEPDERGR